MMIHLNRSHEIYIPKEYWDISKYRSTLGHKFNHSFKFNKSKYGYADHPRFGLIRTVVAIGNINKGEEIFTHYNYPDGNLVPKWYSDLYFQEIGEDWYKNSESKYIAEKLNLT